MGKSRCPEFSPACNNTAVVRNPHDTHPDMRADSCIFLDGEHADFECMTKQHFHHARGEVTSVLILIASAFSTVFSAIWLGLATGKPHYGQVITHNSSLPPGTAAVLVAAFAKSIELTFVTTFVAFLGQLLSQRAFRKNSNGVTIAEMQMRQWILQPGTLITHFASVRYAAITLLGALAFIAALLAILYTTASDALGMQSLLPRENELQAPTDQSQSLPS